MKRRRIYLDDIPLEEAWERFSEALKRIGRWSPFPGEEISTDQALGRVTAEAVWASISSPAYHSSAMDGYAVHADDTRGASDVSPIQIALGEEGPAFYVDTGDPLPPWADAVVMIENTQLIAENKIEIRAGVAPWTSVRSMGEDMVATELILPANHLLTPVDLGAITGCGHSMLMVRRKPRVAILPTGTELVKVEEATHQGLKQGEIIEYNSLVLAAQVRTWGGEPTNYPICPDDYQLILKAVQEAATENDLVLIIAGSSAGSEDYTSEVISKTGELLVHGVAIKPGHPVALGVIERDGTPIPVIGVPGYPVSCALTGEIFIEPLVARWLGLAPREKPKVQAIMTRKLLSAAGSEEWVRVFVGRVGDRTVAAPLSRGAGLITSLVRADGIVRIPRLLEGVRAGEEVTVELYREPADLEKTIVHIGSHDLGLDLLAQSLARSGRRLTSANAGSLGGIMALKRGEAHIAGSHLLDPLTGEYNVSYVRKYLPDVAVVLLTFAYREQGLIVSPGNPKGIRDLRDLARPEVSFVNRQRGAGTRILLDYRLEQLGIVTDKIRGYQREEYTHLAVAAAVQSGVADCGMGIAAAAGALNLDFLPLEQEQYHLVIPTSFYESEHLRPLIETVKGKNFRRAIGQLPGYDATHSGEIITL